MNGFIKTTVAGLCLGTGLTLVGCSQYRQIVDPCWPDRYNAEARLSVRDTFGAQVHDGHVLDQTMWNYHFVDPNTGLPTDQLNAAGVEHLQYLARRQPVADPRLFLQTAQLVPAQLVPSGENLAPDKLAQARSELDNKRIAAIQRYLAGMMSGRAQAVAFDVVVHDPAEVGIAATPIGGAGSERISKIPGAINGLYRSYKGTMGDGGGAGGGAGAAGGGGGVGSGGGGSSTGSPGGG